MREENEMTEVNVYIAKIYSIAKPEKANELYEYFCEECSKTGIKVEKGIFGADMKVSLINDGPVTIIMER